MHFNMKDDPADKRREEDEELEEFEDEEDESESNHTFRLLSGLFVVAAVGAFVALAWYAYQSGVQPISEDDIPTVADGGETPLKEKPAEPGGWQFDHQDKSVYNQLAAGKGTDGQSNVERIMPAPEEPVNRPQPETKLAPVNEVAAVPVTEVASAPVAPVEPKAQEVPTSSVIPVPETAAIPAEEPVLASPPAPAPTIEKETVVNSPVAVQKETPKTTELAKAAPAEAKPAAVASGAYMAQLGAFSSQNEAEKAWDKVRAAHSAKLGALGHKVVRADLGAKGVFYRLQMGPFASEASARETCAYLQARKQGCFIVKN